ncbi:MAG: alpha/beta fold hydrolase [Terasakiella sp.]|uniref:alpha/beta fold hydrolase n=1 Tax=unclassified Terasakiella TaxID=2614952 RepID=UPI003B003E7E
MSWNPDLQTQAESLIDQISTYPEESFRAALDAEAFLQAQHFLAGVRAYHKHPYIRHLPEVPVIWQDGTSRLLDYGGPDNGPVVLAVPSLINKAYILDLTEKRSLMRSLANKGIRCFLLDWGEPGAAEKEFTLEDYILGRLNNAVTEIHHQCNRPVTLIGYCMGGVLCTALAALEPDKIDRLALLATPWDFHAGSSRHAHIMRCARPQLESLIETLGLLPIDMIQSLFAAIDPYQILQKFIEFSEMDPASAAAKKFVTMEDWINDGVPLVADVARDCLFGWYIDNKPARGIWEIDGHFINPKEIRHPAYLVIPQNDRIVSPESAHALAQKLPNCQVKTVKAGHIGMMTGRNAQRGLYTPLAKWLLTQEK